MADLLDNQYSKNPFYVGMHHRKLITALPHMVDLKRVEQAFIDSKNKKAPPAPGRVPFLNQILRDAGIAISPEWDRSREEETLNRLDQPRFTEAIFKRTPIEGQYTPSAVTMIHIPQYLAYLNVWMYRRRPSMPPAQYYFSLLSVIVGDLPVHEIQLDLLTFYNEMEHVRLENDLFLDRLDATGITPYYRNALGHTHILIYKGEPKDVLAKLRPVLEPCNYYVFRYDGAWWAYDELHLFDKDANVYNAHHQYQRDHEYLSTTMLGFMRHRKLQLLIGE